jgi:hypothetical protein
MAGKRAKKQKPKLMVGLREKVAIRAGDGSRHRFTAKFDTGAKWSRIGASKAAKLRLGPILEVRQIPTSDGGTQRRVIVPASLRVGGHRIDARFTVSVGKSGVLIGRRTIGSRFTVDPKKSYLAGTPRLH